MSIYSGSERKIADQITAWFKSSREGLSSYRASIREDYDFYAGRQWDAADEQFLQENKRPIITFNRIGPTIDAVTGSERFNRQAIRYLPRTLDDGPLNEMITNVAQWVRDRSDAEDEESEAFQDCLITGIGFTDTWLDIDDDPDGQIRIQRISPLEMYWDINSRKRNLSDAVYMIRVRLMDIDEIKQNWPGKKLRFDEILTLDNEGSDPHDATAAKFYRNDQSGRMAAKKSIPVLQCQWWEKTPGFRVANPNGQVEELSQEELNSIKDIAPEVQAVRITKKRYYQAFVAGGTLLEKEELHGGDVPGFTFRPITGKRDEDRKTWFGLMRAMKDPQRWSNKFFSQILDIINSNAKGGILAEKGAFSNIRDAERKWAKPDAIVELNDGALSRGMIQERKPAPFPSGLDRLMQVAMGAVRDTTGVNLEFLGLAERTQPGVVEGARTRQGLTTLALFFDSLRRYRKEQGRLLLHFINRYIDEGTLIRIVGEDRYVQFSKQPDMMKFDIIVDEAPTSPNMKQEVWAGLQQVLPALIKSGFPLPPDIIDFLPLPSSVIAKFKKFYASQAPSEEQQKMKDAAAQAQLQQLFADIKETESKALENAAKAQSLLEARKNDAAKTQLDALKMVVDSLGSFQESETRSTNPGDDGIS